MSGTSTPQRFRGRHFWQRLALFGPGILIAATGVGAGDLATGALTGSHVGLTVLWAVLVGAFLKFVLTEGLTRWQLATGDTLIEGVGKRLGFIPLAFFLAFLVLWGYYVGSALMSACGVTAHALFPLVDPKTDKVIYGTIHSLLALGLVFIGGFRLVEKTMSVMIGIMFITVCATTIAANPDWIAVGLGLLIPTIPIDFENFSWTIALLGGVGGTVTILCYGYWIREKDRETIDALPMCRLDLAIGYIVTAIFGICMVILGSQLNLEKVPPALLIVQLADQLKNNWGAWGDVVRWLFLAGAWGAVASSLLGVWQSLPYLFADVWYQFRFTKSENDNSAPLTKTSVYKIALCCTAVLPLPGLLVRFDAVQKTYALVGAAFLPLLAITLLVMNGRADWVGQNNRNSTWTKIILSATIFIFLVVGWFMVFHK